MANLKEIKNRIDSVSSTMQITSVMKMVSASKLRKTQNAVLKWRPYSQKMREIVDRVGSIDENLWCAAKKKENKSPKVLLVVVASNKGLCGTFNTNVVKQTLAYIDNFKRNYTNTQDLYLMTIGKKVTEFFAKQKLNIVATNDEILNRLSFENTIEISEGLIEDFKNGKYDKIDIIYNCFRNAATQELVTETFLPLSVHKEIKEGIQSVVTYDFLPDKDSIIEELVPRTLKLQLYKILLDSSASEHGARMTSMHKATDNAQSLIKSLKLTYNKARQTAITNEILEIVNGAEALKNF